MVTTAFIIGLVGSFHCLGMCGPIALALPLRGRRTLPVWLGRLSYNAGRITTYALLGGTFGLMGQGLALAGWQQSLSVALGVLILLSVGLPATFAHRLSPNHVIAQFIGQVKTRMHHLFAQRTYSAQFGIGMLNGLLPCGLVYIGLAGAMASGHFRQGAEWMIAFGAGTLPMMLGVSLLGQWVSVPVRNRIRKSIPLLVGAMGVLFILRGLALDIPYVSPVLSGEMTMAEAITICR
ncbi:MAG: sulfite exporter TauE/SafE family protein [Bacteroidota bacterium]